MGGGGLRRGRRRLQQVLAPGLDTQGLSQREGYSLELHNRCPVVSDVGEKKESVSCSAG